VTVRDPDHVLCVAESASLSYSPFQPSQTRFSIAFTEDSDAMEEFRMWTDAASQTIRADNSEREDAVLSPLMDVLQDAEKMTWLDLECNVLRTMQTVNQLDLEGEPLFLTLSRTIRDLLSPVLYELELENPADFWPGRARDWTWMESALDKDWSTLTLTPRLKRLLFRRERVLFVEEMKSAPDIQFTSTAGKSLQSGFLLPLTCGTSPLGIIKIFYGRTLYPLAGEVEALELLRRELSILLDHIRTHLRMQRMATVDGLTNLFNHRFFQDQLRTEYQRALRYNKSMTLLMIDIDDFKGYNDKYGHLAGDRVLAETARTIRNSVRDIDFVARYGGDEFALILPEVEADGGMIVAEKIRKAVEAQRFISEDGETIGSISVSCGVTDNRSAASPDILIERADKALYWVKRHGRNLVRLASDNDQD